ncbi:OLC1v1009463C2 [Oldenlandia corymbosa var. corymbosa]|nr:OLC1v1009463C2 [Oldenlandia corymbosa var. corymbosa]
MEIITGAKIRLRTRKNKYLTAGSDKESVRLERDGSAKQAVWTVEFVDGKSSIRIKSIYGKYLTATNEPLIPKAKGHKVLQTLPERLNSSTEWEMESDDTFGKDKLLRFKTHYGQYLRPYGGLPPFRNKVGHDVPCRTQTEDKIQWELEILETGDR